ncbi:unnamed protein product, partial [Didymodactylos carnosus]
QQQQPSIIDDNQSAASLPNIPLNVATQVHIQNLLDSIVNFNGTNEDIRAWIQCIELLFDLADYTKFKWIKLTALHLGTMHYFSTMQMKINFMTEMYFVKC